MNSEPSTIKGVIGIVLLFLITFLLVLVEAEEQKKQKQNVKLSQILKDATEGQCFGYLMKVSKTRDLGENHHHHHQITSTPSESVLKVCVNGLLMSKSGIVDESSTTLSIYGYVADDDDILEAYRNLGIDPYHRIKCNKCDLIDDGYHLYRVLEHMNDYHRASFKEIGSYLETLGL